MSVEKRLEQELALIRKNPIHNCAAEPSNSDILKWNATIFGPIGTPYANGVFKLEMYFPSEYPFVPPKVKFVTPIYHCNVSKTGNICLDILKSNWSPALTVSKVLLSVCSLLSDANPEDPLESKIAFLFKTDRETHDSNARRWTEKFA